MARWIQCGLMLGALAQATVLYGEAVKSEAPLEARLTTLAQQADSPWIILPYRPNYIMPLTYSSHPNNLPLRELEGDKEEFDKVEVKFQLSLMLPLAEDLAGDNGDLYAAYSQVSFWNAYNRDASSPFRDTNYEPEMFVLFDTDVDVAGFKNRAVSFGAVHQSNGRGSEDLSRSWNRLYTSTLLERGNFAMKVKPWWRLPEDSEDDNNPNIDRYVGYGDVAAFYKQGEQLFSATVRNNLRSSGNKGSVELGWSHPLHKRLKWFVQYFNGYAECLLDYDQHNQRVGVGLMLSDWL
ncbi:MAG: phospholipase A [Lentisphaerae bacterium]|nr:phospholipase A [Lentisphaerota bacterium]